MDSYDDRWSRWHVGTNGSLGRTRHWFVCRGGVNGIKYECLWTANGRIRRFASPEAAAKVAKAANEAEE